MKIRIKGIEHGVEGVAPFTGAVVQSVGCKMKCKGCSTRHLKKEKTLKVEAEDIVNEILSNSANQGIILSGLEWSEQPMELLELAKVSAKHDLIIMIYTGCDILEFYDRIGRAIYQDTTGTELTVDKMAEGFFEGFLATLGASSLDFFTPEGYFLKCGVYDRDDPADEDYGKFGVHLSSNNQKIYKIKGEYYEDKD